MAFRYHDGERAVQARAGVERSAARLAAGVGDTMPGPARAFLDEQRLIGIGARDGAGTIWASLLTGPEGFARAVDARTLEIEGELPAGDPLRDAFDGAGSEAGTIAIDPASRRRMRANGVMRRSGGVFRLTTGEVYANCPKYITARSVVDDANPFEGPLAQRSAVAETSALAASDRALVEAADAFFIATARPDGGADVSHRGGLPGFVRVHDDGRLSWPDYHGNSMFMTLGNLAVWPHAGLVFVDWERGTTLQVSGRASIDWEPARAAAYPGAERVLDFTIERAIRNERGMPLRWAFESYSRFDPEVEPHADDHEG